MPELDDEARVRLNGANWDHLLLILKRHALRKARRLYWRRQDYEQLAEGETAEGVVSWAVTKVFSGERTWDWVQHPNLEDFLKGVIDSQIGRASCREWGW